MGTALSAICGLTYPLHYPPLLRATWMVIMDDNAMLMAFISTDIITNSIFFPIAPVNAMEDTMVATIVAHPVLIPIEIAIATAIAIPILLPIISPIPIKIKIKIKIQTQIRLEILYQNPSGSTFIHLTRIRLYRLMVSRSNFVKSVGATVNRN